MVSRAARRVCVVICGLSEGRAPNEASQMRARIAIFLTIIQAILFAAHWFVYDTWMDFTGAADPADVPAAKVVVFLLSTSFVITSLLAFRYSNTLIRILYTLSAVWLGMLSFFFFAAG